MNIYLINEGVSHLYVENNKNGDKNMKVSLNSSSSNVPSWFAPELEKPKIPTGVNRINTASVVTDEILSEECDFIDTCATNRSKYCYNSTWPAHVVAHLKEYALASGVEKRKIVGYDPSEIKQELEKESSSKKNLTKTASTQETSDLSALWKDPFKIDEHLEEKAVSVDNWEKVTSSKKLSDRVSFTGINALRGGEDYNKNSDIDLAKNQNSITNPHAIEALAESDEEDTGVRLRREKEERLAAREQEKENDWQEKVADAEKAMGNYSHGNVFPTESLTAQPGLEREGYGVYKQYSPDDVPDKTRGELISEANKERRESIQRKSQKDRSWDTAKSANIRTISDDFASQLKKLL